MAKSLKGSVQVLNRKKGGKKEKTWVIRSVAAVPRSLDSPLFSPLVLSSLSGEKWQNFFALLSLSLSALKRAPLTKLLFRLPPLPP